MIGDIINDIFSDSNDHNKFKYLNCIDELDFYQCTLNYTRVTDNSFVFINHILMRTNDISYVQHITYCSNITDNYTIGLPINNL